MKKLILIPFLYSCFASSQARIVDLSKQVTRQDLITRQINYFQMPKALAKFDGRDFELSDADVKASLSAQYAGTADANKEKQYAKFSTAQAEYKLTWARQDLGNGLDLRINQAFHNKEKKDLRLLTTTFNGDHIRSTTLCRSSTENKGSGAYCATATKYTCRDVIKIYEKNDTLREIDKKVIGGVTGKVKECQDIMKSYAKILEVFADGYYSNSGLGGNREQIIKEDTSALKALLADTSSKPEIKHLSAATLRDVSQELTSSMQGLRQIDDLVDLCRNNMDNFTPDAGVDEKPTKPAQR